FFLERFNDIVHIRFTLGDQNVFSASGDTAVQSDITSIASHHFNDKDAIVCVHGIADLINRLDSSINCGIETDSEIASVNIFINCTCNTNTGDIKFLAELYGAAKGTIATDDH